MKKQFLKMLHGIMNPKPKAPLPERVEVEPKVIAEVSKPKATPVVKKNLRGKPKLKK